MCDIALMRRVATLVDRTQLLGATRTREIVDELARWTREELDYEVEAANAIAIRENIRDAQTEYAPEVHLHLSTRRVLTAERLDGLPLVDIIRELRADRDGCTQRLAAAGYDLDEAAANVVWNFLGQVYATGVFHGDLHPANVLLLEGNRIGYVDFGIVGRIPQEVQQSLGDYARSLFGGDCADAVDQLLRWLRPSAKTDPDGRPRGDARASPSSSSRTSSTPRPAAARCSRAFRSTCSPPRAGTASRPTRSSCST